MREFHGAAILQAGLSGLGVDEGPLDRFVEAALQDLVGFGAQVQLSVSLRTHDLGHVPIEALIARDIA